MDEKLQLQAPKKRADAEQRAEDPVDEEVRKAHAIARKAEERLDWGDVPEARAIVQKALTLGISRACRVVLLPTMADVEFADSDFLAARACLAEAVDASALEPGAAAGEIRTEAIAGQVRALHRNRLWRDALQAVEEIPLNPPAEPVVRAAAGDFYRDCGCWAHANESYRPCRGLRFSAKAARCWCWLCSGGPVAVIHQRVRDWEKEKLLPSLRQGPHHIDLVDDVGLEQTQQLRLQLETLNYRLFSHWYTWNAVERHGYRLMSAVIVPVWLVLLVVVQQAGFASGWPR